VPRERSDRQPAVGLANGVERLDAVDVDEVRGAHDPEAEGRNEALSACERLRVLAAFGEQLERLLDGVGTRVGERRRLHARASARTA
jgi:hypothetical protein